jgi:hypothetical protein
MTSPPGRELELLSFAGAIKAAGPMGKGLLYAADLRQRRKQIYLEVAEPLRAKAIAVW